MNVFYYFQSPYTQREMSLAMENPETKRKWVKYEENHWKSHCSHHSSLEKRKSFPSGKFHFSPLKRVDSLCRNYSDERGRIILSDNTQQALLYRPLAILWSEGAKRTFPVNFFQSLWEKKIEEIQRNMKENGKSIIKSPKSPKSTVNGTVKSPSSPSSPLSASSSILSSSSSSSPPSYLVSIIGGSNALNSRQLDNKTEFQRLLTGNRRVYSPQTLEYSIHYEETGRKSIELFLSSSRNRYFILKPSAGLKQIGILVIDKFHPPGAPAAVAANSSSSLASSSDSSSSSSSPVNSTAASDSSSPSVISLTVSHIWSHSHSIKALNGKYYTAWVLQEYCLNSLHLSGLELLMIHGEEEILWDSRGNGENQGKNRGNLTDSTNAHWKDQKAYQPKKAGESKPTKSSSSSSSSSSHHPRFKEIPSPHPNDYLPSDCGLPISIYGLYKIHFRVFSIVNYYRSRHEFQPFLCRSVKIYHSKEYNMEIPHQQQRKKGENPLEEGKDEESFPSSSPASSMESIKKWLFHHKQSPIPSYSTGIAQGELKSSENPLALGQSVSKYLAFRLANDIFPPEWMNDFFSLVAPIVYDTIQLSIEDSGFSSHPWAENGFQLLGYDFLWDFYENRPVLLEINHNCGQGLMKYREMIRLGVSPQRYQGLWNYWTKQYREPFTRELLTMVEREFHQTEGKEKEEKTGETEEKKASEGVPANGAAAAPPRDSSKIFYDEAWKKISGDLSDSSPWFVPLGKIPGKQGNLNKPFNTRGNSSGRDEEEEDDESANAAEEDGEN